MYSYQTELSKRHKSFILVFLSFDMEDLKERSIYFVKSEVHFITMQFQRRINLKTLVRLCHIKLNCT